MITLAPARPLTRLKRQPRPRRHHRIDTRLAVRRSGRPGDSWQEAIAGHRAKPGLLLTAVCFPIPSQPASQPASPLSSTRALSVSGQLFPNLALSLSRDTLSYVAAGSNLGGESIKLDQPPRSTEAMLLLSPLRLLTRSLAWTCSGAGHSFAPRGPLSLGLSTTEGDETESLTTSVYRALGTTYAPFNSH